MDDGKDASNNGEIGDWTTFSAQGSKPVKPVIIDGNIDSDEYAMTHPKIGKCYIFNHKKFDKVKGKKVPEREGTDKDAERLYCRFMHLGYDIEKFDDLTVQEVNQKLRKASEEDHSDYSSFVCCVLTHGRYGYLKAKNGEYPTNNLFSPFRGDNCPSLVGKPKIFFIQACRGKREDDGVHVACKETLDSDSEFKIPTHADFLIVWSSVKGFCSWKNSMGSWFMRALCESLENYSKTKDLLSILTIVCRKVAFGFQSHSNNPKEESGKKQVPVILSTLTRDIRFPL